MDQPVSDSCPSTTWDQKLVKIRRPAGGQSVSQPKAVRWWRFPPRDPRTPITISISLRGGAECWVEVKGRGSIGRYTGCTAIYDVLMDINNRPEHR